MKGIAAQPKDHAQPRNGPQVLLNIRRGIDLPVAGADAGIRHLEALREPRALLNSPERHVGQIGAVLRTDGAEEKAVAALVAERAVQHHPVIILLDLVAVDGIRREESEIAEERQIGVDGRERKKVKLLKSARSEWMAESVAENLERASGRVTSEAMACWRCAMPPSLGSMAP